MPLPPQTKYIVGNEACERFSFYGMRSILIGYMISVLHMEEPDAMTVYHLFTAGIYILPLLGAWLADRYFGRYRIILYVSLLYCVGHGVLATADLTPNLDARLYILFAGLFIIMLGAGGIKPCVSAFVGDQVGDSESKVMTRIYATFYWSINLGSFFSFLVIPWVRQNWGYGWAFGIPGIFMALATLIFWCGRRHYHRRLPSHPIFASDRAAAAAAQQNSPRRREGMLSILGSLLFRGRAATAARYSAEQMREARNLLRIIVVFAMIVPFWSLFDQTGSSWILQGKQMESIRISSTFSFGAEEMQSINPLLIMVLVPIVTLLVYPYIGKWGSPLRRIGCGIALAGISYGAVAAIQHVLDSGTQLSILWQSIPYLLLTVSEILVSTTGLEYAYTAAGKNLKSIVSGFWFLTSTLGSFLVIYITYLVDDPASTTTFLLYGGLSIAIGLIFLYVTTRPAMQAEVCEDA